MFEKFQNGRVKNKIEFCIVEAEYSYISDITKITHERESGDFDKIRKELDTYFNNENAKLYIAIANGVVAGFAKCTKYAGKSYSHEGWYLSGIIVKPKYRGAGIGHALTKERLSYLNSITEKIYYLANSNNKVSIRLHDSFGFKENTESFLFPGVEFSNGNGSLYMLVK